MRITVKKDEDRFVVVWALGPRDNGARSFATLDDAKSFALSKMQEQSA